MKRNIFVFAVALAAAMAFLLVFVRPDSDEPGAAGPSQNPAPTVSAATAPPSPTAPTQAVPTVVVSETGSSTPAIEPPAPTVVPAQDVPLVGHPPPPVGVVRARASRLADGDSFDVIWLDGRPEGIRRDEVRMLGINAPETEACFGRDARNVLHSLINDREILVEIVETEDGGNGRQIANVWAPPPPGMTEPVLINLAMVNSGAALALSGDGPYERLISDAQARARVFERGLWAACAAASDIAIANLSPDAPGRDDFNPNGEWIEIVNAGAAPADLTGWGIRDESTRHRYQFPDGFRLAPGQEVRIGSGCGYDDNDERVDLFWCAWDPVWNNSGDTAFLVDADGRFVDEWSYDG